MSNEETDVAALVEMVRRHDPAAARQLVAALYALVIGIVRAHLPRRQSEEDMAQEAFLKIFARLDQYRPQAGIPFEHWAARLTVRTCYDALRSERRRPERRLTDLSPAEAAWVDYLSSEESPNVPDNSPEAARGALEQLLSLLRPEDRSILHWLDLQGMSVKQISQMTGWSESSVKVKAFRARRKLKAIAARSGQEFLP